MCVDHDVKAAAQEPLAYMERPRTGRVVRSVTAKCVLELVWPESDVVLDGVVGAPLAGGSGSLKHDALAPFRELLEDAAKRFCASRLGCLVRVDLAAHSARPESRSPRRDAGSA